jgi:protein farnesyltransferase/geranylgeranyltransferase type-1 subunit alpha
MTRPRSLLHIEEPDDFDDLTPVPCPQDPDAPFGITYTIRYDTFMSIYRALLDKMELSPRALAVTTRLNTATIGNATAWWYRQQILQRLGYSLADELAFLRSLMAKTPKPYQLWCHRTWLIDQCKESPDETEFAHFVLALDEKNFHAWSYFGWYSDKFLKWQWLFDITTPYIRKDPMNNSAWSARYRAIKKGGLPIDPDIDFALESLRATPRAESTCNYIRGLLGMESSPERAEKVKGVANEICEGKMKTRTVCQLAAHIALMQGNRKEYEQIIDRIILLDPRRTHFWNKMKASAFD